MVSTAAMSGARHDSLDFQTMVVLSKGCFLLGYPILIEELPRPPRGKNIIENASIFNYVKNLDYLLWNLILGQKCFIYPPRRPQIENSSDFLFPIRLIDENIFRLGFQLLPGCNNFIIQADYNETSRLFTEFKTLLPKQGKYVLIGFDARNDVLQLPFFAKAIKTVSYVPKQSSNNYLFQANIRRNDETQFYNYWNGTRHLLKTPIIPGLSKSIKGSVLRAITFDASPSTYLDENGKWSGYENRIMETISENLGITLEFIQPPDNEKWGSVKADGTFNGLVGELQFDRADVGWANLFIKTDRAKVIDFTEPYRTDPVCFMYKKPPPAPQWMAVMSPLDIYTWIGTFGGIIFVSLALSALTKSEYTKDKFIPYSKSITMIIGTLIDSSSHQLIMLQSISSRLFIGIWLLVAIVIETGYKGMLISVLTVPIQPLLIDTLQELGDFHLPVASFGDTFFKIVNESSDPSMQKMAQRYQVHFDFFQAAKDLNSSKVVLGESLLRLQFLDKNEFTNEYGESSNHILRQCTYSFNVGIGMPKDSPYNERISAKLIQLKEGGIISKYIDIDFAKAGKEKQVANKNHDLVSYERLGLYNVQVGLVLYGFGIVVATVCFIFENAFKTVKKQQNNRRIKINANPHIFNVY